MYNKIIFLSPMFQNAFGISTQQKLSEDTSLVQSWFPWCVPKKEKLPISVTISIRDDEINGTVNVECDQNDTICTLKRKLQQACTQKSGREFLDDDAVNLMYNECDLNDPSTILKDLGVDEGATLYGAFSDIETVTDRHGDTYTGQFKDGKLHGQGMLVTPDGKKYVGQWQKGRLDGYGTFTDAVAGSKYEGEWMYGMQYGKGRSSHADGPEGGEIYEGEWRMNKRHGQGTCTRTDGERYEGEWENDKRHGKGKSSLGEMTLEGHFEEDMLVYGKVQKHGLTLEGQFEKYHLTNGIQTHPDGCSEQGEFRNGELHGHGVQTFADGSKFEGHWKNGRLEGQGIYRWPDGRQYSGHFSNHRFDPRPGDVCTRRLR